MALLRYNNLSGTLGGALTAGATTVTFVSALQSPPGTNIPTLSGGQQLLLTIDPATATAEIVLLTGYTSGAVSGTVTRAQQGTVAVGHTSTATFVNALTTAEVTDPANNLSDLVSAATARTNLGLGTAATQLSTAFDAAGAATTAQAAAKTAADGTYVTVVVHGAVAGTARPAGAVRVFWVGSVSPTNAITYDRWVDTSSAPYTERIYNGTAFTTFMVAESQVTNLVADLAAKAPRWVAVFRTTAYTAVDGDIVIADATAGAFTVTLPTPTAGRTVAIRKIDASANVVTVTTPSGAIDGLASRPYAYQYQTQKFVADGTNWQRLDVVGVTAMATTGTPSATTFLRGDGSWQTTPVTSVAGRTGAVVIALADVAGAINAAGAPVQTVAGRTGAVVLAVADVSGAAPVVESVNTVATSGATQTIPDVTTATTSRIILTAACTFTFPTLAAGKSFTITLVQDATGGRTAVWPASVLWSGGTAPTLTATANKRDVLTFVAVDATNWLGFTAGLNF